MGSTLFTYQGAVHESTGVSPNLLTLGRELEVPLDVITKRPPNVIQSDCSAVQKRLASAHDLDTSHLNKAAV